MVEKTLSGDRDAFADLVDRYVGLVHGVIAHRIRRPDEVEDLVQDVFCKAFQELHRLREPAKFASWLGRIATNRAQAWLRQRQAHKTTTTPDLDALGLDSGDHPETAFDEREAHAALWRAVDRLRPDLRQVVMLFHFEDCPQSDIARFLGISVPTVKWRLMRARKSMRRELEGLAKVGPEGLTPDSAARRDRGRRLRQGIMAALPAAWLLRATEAPALSAVALQTRALSLPALSLRALLAGRGWVALAGGLGAAGAMLVAAGISSARVAPQPPFSVRVQLAAPALVAAGQSSGELLADDLPTAIPPCAAGEVRRR